MMASFTSRKSSGEASPEPGVEFKMDKKLQFRRQFLLTSTPLPILEDWGHLSFGPYHLYTHPDLEVCSMSTGERAVVLIGYLFDAAEPEKGNAEILADILARGQTLEEFICRIKPYAGRYVFLYRDDHRCIAVQDALALREVYYATCPNLVVCGSQPNLLAKFSNPQIGLTPDPEIQRFFKSRYRDRKWIGSDTYFENVKHILPNHLLDLETLKASRYWPTEHIKVLGLDEAVQRSCAFLQGMLKAVSHRHPVMMAVTAGTDSRTLLAASKPVSDRIYYFINDHGLGGGHPDIRIPRQIFQSIGLPFHVHPVPEGVDAEFKKVFLSNVFQATDKLLPTIFNVYFKQHSEKVNLLGIGEIGRTRYGKEPRRPNGFRMAYAMGYKDSHYVIKQCEQLLPEMVSVARKFGINLMTLLYWEQMMGNWGAVGNSESDIAMEEFDPYDSHSLYEIFLGVEDKYTKYANSILFREMIQTMWPEVLNWPINPPRPGQDRAKSALKKLRLHGLLKNVKYQVNYLRYRCS